MTQPRRLRSSPRGEAHAGHRGRARPCPVPLRLRLENARLRGQAGADPGHQLLRLEDGPTAEYREVFDTGIALSQLSFPGDRIKRVLNKKAAAQNAAAEARVHLRRFEQA